MENRKTPLDNHISIPANKSYIEPWEEQSPAMKYNPDADRDVVRDWSSLEHQLVWYLELAPGEYLTGITLQVEEGQQSSFQFTVSSPSQSEYDETFETLAVGVGTFQEVQLGTFQVKEKGFYRLELNPVSKTGAKIAKVKSINFQTNGEVRFAKWLSSPSVHLRYQPEDQVAREYDWLYGEINVPEGYDPLYTFYMCIGFYRGYFGIQVNSSIERRVLFSVWDSSEEHNDRDNVQKENLVSLVDKGHQVNAGSFGNEGTGGQSYWKYPWNTGVPVKFIMNVRKLKNKSALLSAWFKDVETEGWKYMATWRAPKEDRYFNGFYSFLENFGNRNGQKVRKAYYYNMWGKEVGGNWVNFNLASMTHTDGVPEGRSDYAGGLRPGSSAQFFMSSGGYTPAQEHKTSISERQMTAPTVDLNVLKGRVNKALKNEITPLDKSMWKVLDFSSEETSGEGAENGRAADAIDGHPATFWHSQWSGSQPGYPHFIRLDLGEQVESKGMIIQNRSKSNGRPESIHLSVSKDCTAWSEIGDFEIPVNGGNIDFPETKTFRYMKLTVNSGHHDGTEKNFFVHIAEIGLY
ncbi:DUF3472 domain-containing protein [Rapidithrix thailandica]|uniref:DUF3472 domain-containing protein n=1 Tax=Rapidithrix thailandica TaxID=413964 RepID=A0AAW9S3S9_9BACT